MRFVNDFTGIDDMKYAQKVSQKSSFNVYPQHSGQSDQNCYLLPSVSPNFHNHRHDIICLYWNCVKPESHNRIHAVVGFNLDFSF